ncbi:MAG: ribonuclease III [Lachnospiraceae bacterium]|nr:ribonuclease III [Lachnospiraceae bacterium]
MTNKYDELENSIGYHFKDIKHLDIALTHKSYVNEKTCVRLESYERYEFLGDAILEYLTSEFLFKNYPDKTEGELTKLRASLVCEFTLSKIARELKLGIYGYFSKGERHTGGPNRDSILCDMFESLLGAIYMDGGIECGRSFVETFLLTDIEHKQLFYDSKSMLQEYAQKQDKKLSYILLEENGPDHNKEFKVQVMMDDKIGAVGVGHSRKSAEQMAAYNTLYGLKQSISVL